MARPYTFIFSTGTVDGRIAAESGYSRFSCEEDFQLQHRYRAEADAVMVGIGTVLADDPRLTVRLTRGRSPLKVVVDSKLRIPPNSRVLDGDIVVFTSNRAPRDREEILRRRGAAVVRAGEDRVDLARAMEVLRNVFSVKKLMVEGGGTLNCSMIAGGLVDQVRYTVSPYIVGAGISFVNCSRSINGMVRLALRGYKLVCGGWLHLVYDVIEPRLPLD